MANHKSAIKRIKQNERRRIRNKAVRTRVKNVTKALREAVAANTDVEAKLREAIQVIDRAASKGVIPKRRASRKISRLTMLANGQGEAETAEV